MTLGNKLKGAVGEKGKPNHPSLSLALSSIRIGFRAFLVFTYIPPRNLHSSRAIKVYFSSVLMT